MLPILCGNCLGSRKLRATHPRMVDYNMTRHERVPSVLGGRVETRGRWPLALSEYDQAGAASMALGDATEELIALAQELQAEAGWALQGQQAMAVF